MPRSIKAISSNLLLTTLKTINPTNRSPSKKKWIMWFDWTQVINSDDIMIRMFFGCIETWTFNDRLLPAWMHKCLPYSVRTLRSNDKLEWKMRVSKIAARSCNCYIVTIIIESDSYLLCFCLLLIFYHFVSTVASPFHLSMDSIFKYRTLSMFSTLIILWNRIWRVPINRRQFCIETECFYYFEATAGCVCREFVWNSCNVKSSHF